MKELNVGDKIILEINKPIDFDDKCFGCFFEYICDNITGETPCENLYIGHNNFKLIEKKEK